MTFDIYEGLKQLKLKRTIFHCEADFQFALAWALKERYGDLIEVRLEQYIQLPDQPKFFVDIAVYWNNQEFIPIELKYKTKRGLIKTEQEEVLLTQQGAQPIGRFDYLADLQRLEKISEVKGFSKGYAIMLTNDSSYISDHYQTTKGGDFSIGDGLIKSGLLKWHEDSMIANNKHRRETLNLRGTYQMKWTVFHDFQQGRDTTLYLLVNEVSKLVNPLVIFSS